MQFPVNLLLAGVIIVVAWILNLSAICAMRSLNSGTRVVYAFLSSLCVANLFLATLDFPPPIISKILVSMPMQHVMCVSWIYLDTLLCNVLILHLLGCSLDSYLRLRHPFRYLDSTKQVLTCLKLSAPWTLSFVQSTAFMAIAQISEATIQEGVCHISDPNFLILRSVMCFGFPISVSSILVFLSAKSLSTFVGKPQSDKCVEKKEEEIRPNEAETYQLLSPRHNLLNRDETLETIVRTTDDQTHLVSSPTFECANTLDFYQHQCPQHGILSIPIDRTASVYSYPTTTPKYEPFLINPSCDVLYQCCSVDTTTKEPLSPSNNLHSCASGNQHCPDVVPTTQSPISTAVTTSFAEKSLMRNLNINLPQSRSSGDIFDTHSHCCPLPASQSLDLQRMADTRILAEVNAIPSTADKLNACTMRTINRIRVRERTTIAINLTLCIISILFWGPFIIGSLIQGVCKYPVCFLPISNARINEFKWSSYVLCIIYPLVIVIIDRDIRRVIKSSLNC